MPHRPLGILGNLALSPLPSWPWVVSAAHSTSRAPVCTPLSGGPILSAQHHTRLGKETPRGSVGTLSARILSLGLATQPGSAHDDHCQIPVFHGLELLSIWSPSELGS